MNLLRKSSQKALCNIKLLSLRCFELFKKKLAKIPGRKKIFASFFLKSSYVITYHCKFRSILLLYHTKGLTTSNNHMLFHKSVTFFFGSVRRNRHTIGGVGPVTEDTTIKFVSLDNNGALTVWATK
jgi:hypothetical protein